MRASIVFVALLGLTAGPAFAQTPALDTPEKKTAYAIGQEIGKSLKNTGMPVDAAILIQSHQRDSDKPSKAARIFRPMSTISTHSAGVKLASVARGESDIYVNTYNGYHDWDICAGHVLVTEAGGKVTDLSGNPVAYGQADFVQPNGLFGTSGRIHAEVVRLWAKGE